jgi:hypothetical protein
VLVDESAFDYEPQRQDYVNAAKNFMAHNFEEITVTNGDYERPLSVIDNSGGIYMKSKTVRNIVFWVGIVIVATVIAIMITGAVDSNETDKLCKDYGFDGGESRIEKNILPELFTSYCVNYVHNADGFSRVYYPLDREDMIFVE